LIGDLVTGPTDWPYSHTMQKTARCSFDWWTVAYGHSWSPELYATTSKTQSVLHFGMMAPGLERPGRIAPEKTKLSPETLPSPKTCILVTKHRHAEAARTNAVNHQLLLSRWFTRSLSCA